MGKIDQESGQLGLGPSTGDTAWVLAIHAVATALPNAAERSKLIGIRSRSMSERLNDVIDVVLARS